MPPATPPHPQPHLPSPGQHTLSTTTLSLIDDHNPTGYAQVLEERSPASALPARSYVLGSDVLAQAKRTDKTVRRCQ